MIRERTKPTNTSMPNQSDTIFVTSATGKLYAINADTAEVRWSYNLSSTPYKPVIADDSIFLATEQGTLHSISAANGAQKWRKGQVPNPFLSRPGLTNENVITFTTQKSVKAVGRTGGEESSTFSVPAEPVVQPVPGPSGANCFYTVDKSGRMYVKY
jgi:outer membrane protein assembly factor BamB